MHKNNFLERNENIKDIIENNFYNLGGIQTYFKGVYEDFILNKVWRKQFNQNNNLIKTNLEEQFTFEYIDSIEQLYLPVYYKCLIEMNERDNFDELTHNLYNFYSTDNKDIKELLEPIDGIPKIPLEILCKYYRRLYTIKSKFYKDLNKSLRDSNSLFSVNENYNSIMFAKLFYEGIKLGSFPLILKEKLYRFTCMEKYEFEKIKNYLKDKKENLPAVICFSKSFLSFSEEESVSKGFFYSYKKKKNENLIPVFFI